MMNLFTFQFIFKTSFLSLVWKREGSGSEIDNFGSGSLRPNNFGCGSGTLVLGEKRERIRNRSKIDNFGCVGTGNHWDQIITDPADPDPEQWFFPDPIFQTIKEDPFSRSFRIQILFRSRSFSDQDTILLWSWKKYLKIWDGFRNFSRYFRRIFAS